MAYVLIEPEGTSKGVLVLKHLEIRFFERLPFELMDRLRTKYVIGLYFGFAIKVRKDCPYVDFYIAADNVILGYNGEVPRLALNGFNFIDKLYSRREADDYVYDFIFVGNSQYRKNLLELMRSIPMMEQSARFCIINRVGPALESRIYSCRVRRELNKLASEKRKNVLYLEIPPGADGIPHFLVSSVMRRSRALICISRSEGAARVVAEAALSDMSIVYYTKMVGGTCNHLSDDFDFPVETIKDLPSCLDRTVYQLRKRGRVVREDGAVYLESNSKPLVVSFLRKHFSDSIGEESLAKIAVKSLYNAFSGHQNHLPADISTPLTDEILSYRKMFFFVHWLLGESKVALPSKYFGLDLLSILSVYWMKFKGVVKAIIA